MASFLRQPELDSHRKPQHRPTLKESDERVSGVCELVSAVRSRPNDDESLRLTPITAADEIAQAFARKGSVLRPNAFGGITEVCAAYETIVAASLRQPVNPKARDSSPTLTSQLALRHGLRADAKARLEPEIGGDRLRRLARTGMAVGALVVASCLLGAIAWGAGNKVGEPPRPERAVSVLLPSANSLATTAAPRLVAAAPAYQGADEFRLTPFPAIDIKQGWSFANPRNGIRIAPIDMDTVTVGAGAVFMPNYRRRDFPDGIDLISSGVSGRLFATVRAGGFVAEIGATNGVSSGTEGTIAEASLSYPVKISSRFKLIPTIGASWANRRHNDAYFGVTQVEALASGLPQFSAGSGFKDVSASLTASYRLTDRITVSANGGATSLMGNVGDSPLVVQKTQPSGMMALNYRF